MAEKPLFERRIDELCKRFGENPTSLGVKAGLSDFTVRNWIQKARSGINPPGQARALKKFAAFWKVDFNYLTEESAAVAQVVPDVPVAAPVPAPERYVEPDDSSLPYAAERERAAARLVLEHRWKYDEARAGVRALLAFVHEMGTVTDEHFVQGALRGRAAMQGKTVGERVAKKKSDLVVDEDQVRNVGDVIERTAERGAALAHKKGKNRREEPGSVRKIKRSSKPHN